ncbi:hypothetical protein ABIE21_003280 [Conyzicola nivalis]|uniref:Uncharacterized protein n=1 Tax=Conyzicola nivalis TaxID=1477021 RepID=A0ABV2QRP4_9MICO
MSANIASSRRPLRRWITAYVAAALFGLLIGIPSVATADQALISGSQNASTTWYAYSTPRTNTYGNNFMAWRMHSDGGTGAPVELQLRNAANVAFATFSSAYMTWADISDGGAPGVRAGTFYMNARFPGQCGGSGCGWVTFSGDLQWNVKYI